MQVGMSEVFIVYRTITPNSAQICLLILKNKFINFKKYA